MGKQKRHKKVKARVLKELGKPTTGIERLHFQAEVTYRLKAADLEALHQAEHRSKPPPVVLAPFVPKVVVRKKKAT